MQIKSSKGKGRTVFKINSRSVENSERRSLEKASLLFLGVVISSVAKPRYLEVLEKVEVATLNIISTKENPKEDVVLSYTIIKKNLRAKSDHLELEDKIKPEAINTRAVDAGEWWRRLMKRLVVKLIEAK